MSRAQVSRVALLRHRLFYHAPLLTRLSGRDFAGKGKVSANYSYNASHFGLLGLLSTTLISGQDKFTIDELSSQDERSLRQLKSVFMQAFTKQYSHLDARSDLGLTAAKLKITAEQFNSYNSAQLKEIFLNNAIDSEIDDYKQGKNFFFVARDAEKNIIGLASYEIDHTKQEVYIGQLAVSPTHWQRGIGTNLIKIIQKKFPAYQVTLLYRTNNPKIDKFYEKLDFDKSSEQEMPPGYSAKFYVKQRAQALNPAPQFESQRPSRGG